MKNKITRVELKNIIYHIRGKAVMLDSDLADLYQVSTKQLNQAVKRNFKRFPEDFMFRMTKEESNSLRSQFVTLENGIGKHSKYHHNVFTEQGVAMLSGVLKSDIAIEVNINIMRAFVQVRRMGMSIVDLKRKLDKMENKYDEQFRIVFDAIRQLLAPPVQKKKGKMGFTE